MSDVFETVGAIVVGLLGLGLTIIALEIVGNLYGGIKGAYRFRAIRARFGKEIAREKLLPHWATIRLGLKAWSGKRFDGDTGYYWRMGGLKVPIDGRDPIRHWWGG